MNTETDRQTSTHGQRRTDTQTDGEAERQKERRKGKQRCVWGGGGLRQADRQTSRARVKRKHGERKKMKTEQIERDGQTET